MITVRDKTGATTTEEKLVNLTETDLDQFKQNFDTKCSNSHRHNMITPGPTEDFVYHKLFDKFFGK